MTRSIFGFPWPQAKRKAFKLLADKIMDGNSSELARTVLEQFLLAHLTPEQARAQGLVREWTELPEPSILRYAIKQHEAMRASRSSVLAEADRESQIVHGSKKVKSGLTRSA
jgi:hypothetical protein